MVKFCHFLLHTIYKCPCCCCWMELEQLRSRFLFFVPCGVPYTGHHGNNGETMQSVEKFNTAEVQLSLWQNDSPRKHFVATNIKKLTPETAPSLYIVYIFVHLYIDWFIQIDSSSSFPDFPSNGRDLNHVSWQNDAVGANCRFFCSFLFVFYIFCIWHVNQKRQKKNKRLIFKNKERKWNNKRPHGTEDYVGLQTSRSNIDKKLKL